jgi:CRISPR-associated endonuclease/helicase Cas3
MDHLKAKSAEFGGDTLAEHTWQVLARLRDQQRLRPELPALLNDPRLWHRAYWACFLHDFGKAAQQFQERLFQDAPSNQFSEGQHRHEVLSLAFIDWIVPRDHEDRLAIISIVVSHHKDAENIFEKYGAGRRKLEQRARIEFLIGQIDDATRIHLRQWLLTFGFQWACALGFEDIEPISLGREDSYSSNAIESALDEFSAHCLQAEEMLLADDEIIRNLFHRGLILTADHSASAGSPPFPPLVLTRAHALRPLTRRHLRDHQAAAERLPSGSAILIAPTGSGKTEAAMLWAAQQLTERPAARLFYTLPYQASMNAMYKRLSECFWGIPVRDLGTSANQTVTIQHSRALLKLYQDLMSADERAPQEAKTGAKRLRNLGKLNYFPVQVFSPYQMLKAAYSLKGYEALLLDYADALFIFDEIHAYEAKRLALIITFIGWLARELRARFFIMTATLPPMVLERLQRTLAIPPAAIIKATEAEFNRSQRHTVHLLEGDLPSQIAERVAQDLKAGKSVLVCCNRVAVAQAVYRDLKVACDDRRYDREVPSNSTIVLLHGRFNGRDRRVKEDILAQKVGTGRTTHGKQPFVAVATQVVEVSLDVDFDVLYTEPAPLEALLQRFGRVNRGRGEDAPLCPVYVYQTPAAMETKNPYLPYQPPALVPRSLEILAHYCGERAIDERLVSDMLAEIYQGDILSEWETEYRGSEESFTTGILNYMQPFRSADLDHALKFYKMFDGVDVLPACFVNDYLDAVHDDNKGYLVASQYLVNISHGQYGEFNGYGLIVPAKKLEKEQYADHLMVDYDEEFGLDLDGARQARKQRVEDED